MWKEYLINLYMNNRGKCIGSLIGLLISIFVILIGFFKTLFVVICVFLGYYIGKKKDNNESIIEVIQRILPSGWK